MQADERDSSWILRTRREARRYWDAHPISVDKVEHPPGTKESFDALWDRFQAGLSERSFEFVEFCRDKRVLEVGCGIGAAGRLLSQHGVNYSGVDYSRRSLELARAHFAQHKLRARFVNADGTSLPFADGSFDVVFSDGVVHHIPDLEKACSEIVRLTAAGGTVRVMIYNRASYHYALVRFVVCPLIWLALHLPFLAPLVALGPAKLRHLFQISRRHGYDPQGILSASTDTSSAGEGNYNPLSYFLNESDMRRIFRDLDDHRFRRENLKYFPLPLASLRRLMEGRWGFFLTMTAYKPSAAGIKRREPD